MNKITQSNSLPYRKVSTCLSAEALDFLSETTDGTSHYAILSQLIKDTAVHPVTTSKRGNIIHLTTGQVECSINSFCQTMSLGRKAMERIIRDFERLGIIRLHRSRLATIADMLCITSWQLSDGTVNYNGITSDQSDPHTDEQTSRTDAPEENSDTPKMDATCEVESKSPADTLPPTSQVSSLPKETRTLPQILRDIQGVPESHIMHLSGNGIDTKMSGNSPEDEPTA